MSANMPVIAYKENESLFTSEEIAIIEEIVKAKDSTLRATKPTKGDGTGAFVWRMVAFAVSPKPAHHCLPVMADFYLPGDGYKDRELQDRLNELADRIIKLVPINRHHGTMAWGRVLGF